MFTNKLKEFDLSDLDVFEATFFSREAMAEPDTEAIICSNLRSISMFGG